MNTFMMQFPPKSFRLIRWIICLLISGVGVGVTMSNPHAFAEATNVPWECSGYSGDAQARCVTTLMELQQEKIDTLAKQLKAQEGIVNQLKEKVDRQEALALSQVQTSKQNSRYRPPYVFPYAYSYGSHSGYARLPPKGFYLNSPWGYSRYYGHSPGYWGYGPPAIGFGFRFGGGHRHNNR
ncbi:hypothetical protein [Nitrospira sp.]|uniref:hypothetical protein n=2 Tax=unclassified Nitrospira TaxID=2652172 RepID=UPI003FCCE350